MLSFFPPPLAFATFISLFLGHSLWTECRQQNGERALLNRTPKLAWNSLLTENWKDSFVLDKQENQLQLFGSSGMLWGGAAGLGVWEFEFCAWLCYKHLFGSKVSCFVSQALTCFMGYIVVCTCSLNRLMWVVPGATLTCFLNLPHSADPILVLDPPGQWQFPRWCSTPSPRTSPGVALEVSLRTTSHINNISLPAAKPLLYQGLRQLSVNSFN